MKTATLSAVIVPVPEADDVVGAHRARMDRAAGWGVPAHVTALFPFLPPPEIDASVLDRLATAVATVPRARATFAATGWFGDDVLWLAPTPSTVFSALTRALSRAFPGQLPYGGQFGEPVPHLTVGHDAPLAELRRAEAAVLPRLPISTDVTAAALWCGDHQPGSWAQVRAFPLGPPA